MERVVIASVASLLNRIWKLSQMWLFPNMYWMLSCIHR